MPNPSKRSLTLRKPTSTPQQGSWLRWPLPALGVWFISWVAYTAFLQWGWPWAASWTLVFSVGVLCALLWTNVIWRRVWLAAGFPLSWLLLGVMQGSGLWGAGACLLALVLLCSLYPITTWSDAPLFPTPTHALQGLAEQAPLPMGAQLLDAGCGLGAGLRALSAQYPLARITGWEWSRPLAWLCARRCSTAQVHRADIWSNDWSDFHLIYMFQRPESMLRAAVKAKAELRPGSYLVSLEFQAPGLTPQARIENIQGKPVWIYRIA